MKYLVVGLGNIGEKYANTRHNIGFNAVDFIAHQEDVIFKSDRYAFVTQIKYKGRIIILCKPTTFMNLSGKAVKYWMQKENIPIENLLIIVDDLSLPYGTIRIKKKGSDAGHNGLIDIIQSFGHHEFNRLRFGIGNEFSRGGQVDFVLGNWNEDENQKLPERLKKISEAIQSFVTIGIERTMNFYNGQ